MKLKNVSSRLHHVGAVQIPPGETAEVDDSFAGAFNEAELELVEAPQAEQAPAPKTTAPKTPAAPKAPPAPPPAP